MASQRKSWNNQDDDKSSALGQEPAAAQKPSPLTILVFKLKKNIVVVLIGLVACISKSFSYLRLICIIKFCQKGLYLYRRMTFAPESHYKQPVCKGPTTVINKWSVAAFVPRPGGGIPAFEYLLDDPIASEKAHTFSIMDIDAKDTRVRFFIDDVYIADTPDFKLDKSINCGDELEVCLAKGFSTGVLVVPPGRHTVKIEYLGKG